MLIMRHCNKQCLNPPKPIRQPRFGECRPACGPHLSPKNATKSFHCSVMSVTFVFACVFLRVSCSFSMACRFREADGARRWNRQAQGRLENDLAVGLAAGLAE